MRGLEGFAPVVAVLLQVLLPLAVIFLPGLHVLAKLLNQVAK